MKPIIVLGAGGHTKVLIDILLDTGCKVLGLLDIDPGTAGKKVLGISVLGTEELLRCYHPDDILLVNGLGSIGDTTARRHVYELRRQNGYRFYSVIHPRAIIGRETVIGEGIQVFAGSVVQPGSVIGDNVIINTNASVDHDCTIGSHSHLAPGATLSGGVHVGEGVHIGTSAVVIQGVKIGARSTIAAGAVIVRDVAAGTTVAGVPGREVQQIGEGPCHN